jgi:hypothetical protein
MAVLDDVPSMAHKLLASLAGRIRDLDRHYFGLTTPGLLRGLPRRPESDPAARCQLWLPSL